MTCRSTTLRRHSAPSSCSRPRLRPLLAHGYEGVDENPTPLTDFVIPAGVITPLVVELEDSPRHPPALVYGAKGSWTVIPGTRTPAYIGPAWLRSVPTPCSARPSPTSARRSSTSRTSSAREARRLVERVQASVDVGVTCPADRRLPPRPLRRGTAAVVRGQRGVGPARAREAAPIREIARQVGSSRQHLITKFKQQVGVPPRLATRLLRLSRVWRLIDSGHSWARVAAESGYADQSHLVHEIPPFTRCPRRTPLITDQSSRRRPAAQARPELSRRGTMDLGAQLVATSALGQAARALVPLIDEHGESADREERLHDDVVEAFHRDGLCQMWVPRCSVASWIRSTRSTLEIASYGDPSAAECSWHHAWQSGPRARTSPTKRSPSCGRTASGR